jgi:hypothetical protein
VFVVWLVLVVPIVGWHLARGVSSVTLEDDYLVLRGPFRTFRTPVSDMLGIAASWWDMYRLNPVIRWRTGQAKLLGPLDGFYELQIELKRRNPIIDIQRL